jgi:hypothetical protein
MQFEIIISTGSIKYLLHVERIAIGKGFERFKVHPKENPEKFIVIQNNRPLIRQRLHLKHKPLTWTLKEGEVKNEKYYQQLLQKINEVLEPPPSLKPTGGYIGTTKPTNRKKRPPGNSTLGERKNK